ncbi:MAG: nucleotide disphospho-sugar-binding domain-containing protein [Propionicimonas sp.]
MVIEDYIPYDTLFPHTDVFVSNGGFGSNMAALFHGVLLVTAGTREGKNDNNVRLAVNHLAVDLRTETPRPGRIRAAVRQALSGRDMKAAVERVQTELATYNAFRIIEEDLQADAARRLTDRRPHRGSH